MASTLNQLIFSLFSCITFILLLLLTQNPMLVNSETLASDIEALRYFRQSVDPNSISAISFLNTWDFTMDPCESTGARFLGILCAIPQDNSSSRVTQIDLEGDGLEGFLPPVIGNLTELNSLNLRRNRFRGPIPDSISNLKKITRLLLSNNFFSGTIPNGFNALVRLETIDLSHNRLSGSFPTAIASLRALTLLTLTNNEFSGRIPNLIGSWQLKTLDLSNNQFYGNLPHFPESLTLLSLAHNLLSGHITPINRLQHLRTLDLSDNRLSGTINQEIFTLPTVSHLNVSYNMFTAITVIKRSDDPSQLRTIEAQSNRIWGHLPLNLITYENLAEINLAHNLFTGVIPKGYGERVGRGWRTLYLNDNMLEGNVPSGFNIVGTRFRGSLAHNCLVNCPHGVRICGSGQRPHSECVRHENDPL